MFVRSVMAHKAWRQSLEAMLFATGNGPSPGSVVTVAPHYYLDPANVTGNASDNNTGTSASKPLLTYRHLQDSILGFLTTLVVPTPDGILTIEYLSSPPAPTDDMVTWWNVMNEGCTALVLGQAINQTGPGSSGAFTAAQNEDPSTNTFWAVTAPNLDVGYTGKAIFVLTGVGAGSRSYVARPTGVAG